MSSVSFDGSFERPQWDENGKMVSSLLIYDAAELRYDASRIDLYSVNPLVGTELKSARKVHVEALQQYSSLLAILNINTNDENIKKYSLRKIYNARKKIYGNVNNNPSTYEQTMVEDNVIALLLANTITEDINALFKDTATIKNINNAFIIPGDYGTGKHSMYS